MPRRLRIAVSVFFALVAVAFAVLWVRQFLETRLVVSIPYAYLILGSVFLASIPLAQGKVRFSLRTMLIATTLIAVVLGLGVWLA